MSCVRLCGFVVMFLCSVVVCLNVRIMCCFWFCGLLLCIGRLMLIVCLVWCLW